MTVDGQVVSSIGTGILILAGIGPDDTIKSVESLASKIMKMRLWPDDSQAQWKKNIQDIDGEILSVSQFTLYGSTKKGNKPDFHGAAKPEKARELYDHFVESMKGTLGESRVKDGVFQAMMEVALVNDGPVTLQMDNDEPKKLPGTATPLSQNSTST